MYFQKYFGGSTLKYVVDGFLKIVWALIVGAMLLIVGESPWEQVMCRFITLIVAAMCGQYGRWYAFFDGDVCHKRSWLDYFGGCRIGSRSIARHQWMRGTFCGLMEIIRNFANNLCRLKACELMFALKMVANVVDFDCNAAICCWAHSMAYNWREVHIFGFFWHDWGRKKGINCRWRRCGLRTKRNSCEVC